MSFKPYYKWITLNTIHSLEPILKYLLSFKPYYKWITLNTILTETVKEFDNTLEF